MPSLVAYIKDKVDAKTYWNNEFPDITWPAGGAEARVKSPLRDRPERTPSLSLNGETGAWYDHGLGQGGNSIVSFHEVSSGFESTNEAAVDLFKLYLHPVIEEKTVRRWRRDLKSTPSFNHFITKQRFVSADVVEQFGLGVSGDRIVMPIKNEFGLFVNAKLYLPGAKKGGPPKMLNYSLKDEPRQFGSPAMIYPIGVLLNTPEDEQVFVCEGEWDALALISMGIMAVTTTAGCKSWPKQYNELFRNRVVVIVYDNDKDGTEYDKVVVKTCATSPAPSSGCMFRSCRCQTAKPRKM